MNIPLRKIEKIVLIVASEKPNILKLTFLQLMVFCFNCSRSSSFDVVSVNFSAVHPTDSLKKWTEIRKNTLGY